MNYYPLKRIRDRIGSDEVNTMTVTPWEKKSRRYCFADQTWEWLIVTTNNHYSITNVSFTPKYKGVWLSLKRAKWKWYKVCRHLGRADRQGL